MKVFGMSFFTLLIIFAAFVLGARNPGAISKLPFVGTK